MEFFMVVLVDEATPCTACGIAIGSHDVPEPVMLPDPETDEPTVWNLSCLPAVMRIPIQCRRQWMWN